MRRSSLCAGAACEYLTLFAFSSENWRRPADEVSLLMRLFMSALQREVDKLHRNGIRLRVVGDRTRFDRELRAADRGRRAAAPQHNARLTLTIAANYGGRWDMLQAPRAMRCAEPSRRDPAAPIERSELAPPPVAGLCAGARPVHPHRRRTADQQFPAVAARIRELYFCDALAGLRRGRARWALAWYRRRERRFGRTSAQLEGAARGAETQPARAACRLLRLSFCSCSRAAAVLGHGAFLRRWPRHPCASRAASGCACAGSRRRPGRS